MCLRVNGQGINRSDMAFKRHVHGGGANRANAHGHASRDRDHASVYAQPLDLARDDHAYDAGRRGGDGGHGLIPCVGVDGHGFRSVAA